MMNNPTAKKWFGAILAAVTLTMVTSVAPASAASSSDKSDTTSSKVQTQKRDTGWGGF